MAKFIVETAILAVGVAVSGYFIQSGLNSFAEKDRTVNVKGLAEMEVEANKVTWPLAYGLLGNDLPSINRYRKPTNKSLTF